MQEKNFKFKKEFGQNFIFDKVFLSSLVKSFGVDKNANILEIGAGMGTLSECLAENFGEVVSFEIDKTLTEHLREVESKHNNLHFVFQDILKGNIKDIDNIFDGESYYMIANLPYYITSPIIFKFLLETNNLKEMFVMVQKEVGVRFCGEVGSKDYGVPTVVLNTFGRTQIVKNVGRKMFTPPPKVDSCIIKITLDRNKFDIKNSQKYHQFVAKCFMAKRKTLYNNLCMAGIEKERAKQMIEMLNLPLTIRPEEVSCENFVKLYNVLQ